MSIYVGTNKIKSIYHGLTKIKSVYVGTVKVFSALPSFSRTITLSIARSYATGGSIGNYALFVGGVIPKDSETADTIDRVDAYNTSLVRSTAPAITNKSANLSSANVGDYALFAGGFGYNASGNSRSRSSVYAYNSSLVRSSADSLTESVRYLAGASNNYAIFGGGEIEISNSSGTSYTSCVDAYNSSLVKSEAIRLHIGKSRLAAASIGEYVIFAGGSRPSSGSQNIAEAYNNSLVKATITSLAYARQGMGGASTDTHAIFGGDTSRAIDAYNASLVRTTPTNSSVQRRRYASVSTPNGVFFAGGDNLTNVIELYDKFLTRNTIDSLSIGRQALEGTVVGKYILFGGGSTGNFITESLTNIIDVFEL